MKLVQLNKIGLATVAERTGIPLRQLRYVVDHNVVKGLKVEQGGRGNARQLALFDALAVSVAAALLQEGVSKPRVSEIMEQFRGARRSTSRHSLWKLADQKVSIPFTRTSVASITVTPWLILSLLKEGTDDE